MLDTLKGNALWGAVLIVLAIIGAVTYLASQSILSGADVLTIVTLVLTGVVGLTSAHVAGQTAAAAINIPPPLASDPPVPLPAEGAQPQERPI